MSNSLENLASFEPFIGSPIFFCTIPLGFLFCFCKRDRIIFAFIFMANSCLQMRALPTFQLQRIYFKNIWLFENLALFFDGLFPICPPLSEIVSHWNVSDGLMMSRGSYKMDESSLSLEHIVIGTNCWPIFQSDRSSDWKERAVPFNPFWKTSQTQILLII